jgi:hypothetical protein
MKGSPGAVSPNQVGPYIITNVQEKMYLEGTRVIFTAKNQEENK